MRHVIASHKFSAYPPGRRFSVRHSTRRRRIFNAIRVQGLPGHMTIEQAKDYDGHSLIYETDTVVPAVVHCHDH